MEKKQITVVIGCVSDSDRILITSRHEPQFPEVDGKWGFPGGKVNFGENPRETIVREIKEEVGFDIEVLELIPHVHATVWNYPDRFQHVIVLCYRCRLAPGSPNSFDNKKDEIREAKWVSIEEARKHDNLRGMDEFYDLL